MFAQKKIKTKRSGAALILSLIFIMVFATIAVSMAPLSGTNVQIAQGHHNVNQTLNTALSGLECGEYIISNVSLASTGDNIVSDDQANTAWSTFCQHVQNTALDGQTVFAASRFSDSLGDGDEIVTQQLDLGTDATFTVRFYRYDSNPVTIKLQSTGVEGPISRQVTMDLAISKDSEVLKYAIASRGRMWVTGDSTIHGDIYSSWDRAEISPFNMTEDSSVQGTINTVLGLEQIQDEGYQLETLDEDNNPMFDEYGDRIYSEEDEIQGYHDGINYDQPDQQNLPGMDIDDYNTDLYNSGLSEIASCPSGDREVEYFPHASGNYNYPRDGSPSSTWNKKLTRHVYENQTFTDAKLPDDRNALFRNCTFEGTLYIDCYKSGSTKYNNVRFEDCEFNGTIVTDVPQQFKWKENALYFTGEATFDNTSDMQEATILAPHFNVNLGNTNPQQGDNNILTGAIVGGIVDVRGNAQIYRTIISMCDTTQWSSGYVTNIGATLDDGGSETTEAGDVGSISVTPDEDKMLPSGITSPIVIKPVARSYSEGCS